MATLALLLPPPQGVLRNPPGSPRVISECMALTPHLWMVVWPRKFWPHLPEKYDGSVNPAKFLQIDTTSILATGGNEAVMANYFPVALIGTTRSWLMKLPLESMFSWEECAASSRPTLRVLTLSLATRPTSMPCSSAGEITVLLDPAVS
jgi:hypothetical protein